MGTHLRVLSGRYLMNIKNTEFRWFSKIVVLVLWTKVALAFEGLKKKALELGV